MPELPAIPRVGGLNQQTLPPDEPEVGDDETTVTVDEYAETLPDGEVTENEDGSAEVVVNDPTLHPESDEFLRNLAEQMDPGLLSTLALEYIELLERDKEARSLRDKQYEEGIKRSGLGKDAPGGADFDGASRVVHPVIAESCVDFCARTMKEIFPPNGPARAKITGKQTQEKLDKAVRKSDFLNWQMTTEVKEYKPQLEQICTQMPLGGSQYHKFMWDFSVKHWISEFVPIDDILLPYSASSFYSAHRMTHVQHITAAEFEKRIISGLYLDTSLVAPSDLTQTAAAKASDKVEGKTETGYNEDGLRDIFEISVSLQVDDDEITGGDPAPYLLIVDPFTFSVLGLYRNWEEEDELREKLHHIVEYTFIPWRGAQGIGLPHLIGGLSAALTGGLRALLDSAHINNSATALKLKGARFGGTSESIQITQVTEVEATGVDDIRKIAMPLPFNPPSEMLFKLIGWLDQKAGGVVSTSEERISDASNSGPVGTTQALIEQGAIVYSQIHSRMHVSQQMALEIISRLNKHHLDEKRAEKKSGLQVFRKDFGLPGDVIPVSDPNIFSEMQRFAQSQSLIAMSDKAPQLYDLRAVHHSILKQMRMPNIEEILPAPKKPKELNPVAENVALVMGQPVAVFPDQDHLAHIQVLLDFMVSPVFGMNPIMTQKFVPGALEHLKQHMIFWYAKHAHEMTSSALGKDITGYMKKPLFEEVDKLLATASGKLIADSTVAFQGVMPIIQKIVEMLQQQAQAAAQGMPLDPASKAALQASQAETARKTAKDQADQALEQQNIASKVEENQEDNETKERIAAAQITKDTQNLVAELNRVAQEEETQRQEQERAHQQQLEQARQEQQHALEQGQQGHQQAIEQGQQEHQQTLEQTVAQAAANPPQPPASTGGE